MTSPEMKPPTPEEQVTFLRHLQRLLDEGSFVATYEYALLEAPDGTEQVDFLYENVGRGSTVTLRPGVAWCFRAFHPMITDMVEGAWSHYVRRYNPDLFNASTDLRAFLFGSERAPLERYRPLLEDLQAGSCFYWRRSGSVD